MIEIPRGPATARGPLEGESDQKKETASTVDRGSSFTEEIHRGRSEVLRCGSSRQRRRRERRNACSVHRQHRNGTVRCKCCTMLITNHYHRRHRDQHQPPPPGYVTAHHRSASTPATHRRRRLIVIVIADRPRFFLRKKLPRRSLSPSAASMFHGVCKHAYTPCHVPRRRARLRYPSTYLLPCT